MTEQKSKFKKYHLPCPACGSSDALSVNEDGSAKCFSCDKFFPKFEENTDEFYTPKSKKKHQLDAIVDNSPKSHMAKA